MYRHKTLPHRPRLARTVRAALPPWFPEGVRGTAARGRCEAAPGGVTFRTGGGVNSGAHRPNSNAAAVRIFARVFVV
jgi:hypothetical protein